MAIALDPAPHLVRKPATARDFDIMSFCLQPRVKRVKKLVVGSLAFAAAILAALSSVVSIADSPSSHSVIAWLSEDVRFARWQIISLGTVVALILASALQHRPRRPESMENQRLRQQIKSLEAELRSHHAPSSPKKFTPVLPKLLAASISKAQRQSTISLSHKEFTILAALTNNAQAAIGLQSLVPLAGSSPLAIQPLLDGLTSRGLVFPIPTRSGPMYSITQLGDNALRHYLKSR